MNRTDRDMTSTQSGYNFAIMSCRVDAKGTVIHYEATVVPVKQGTTGFRAFCTDDSGELWYDGGKAGSKCLSLLHTDGQGLLGSHFSRKIDFGRALE